MKVSYQKHFVEGESTVYTQFVTMTEREFDGFIDRVSNEIIMGLPRKREYIHTNGYEIFMKDIIVKAGGNKNLFTTLNTTQLRFLKLFHKNNNRLKIDRNTIVSYFIS